MSAGIAAGKLTERLTLQTPTAEAIRISSLTRSGSTATATTVKAHGYATKDYVTIAGAVPAGFNGKVQVTVTGTTTFTYAVSSGLSTPATGQITATYANDAQGGRKDTWRTLAAGVPAEGPLQARGNERIAAQAVTGIRELVFRIRSRADLTPRLRALWTPRWPPGRSAQTLEVHAVEPEGDGTVSVLLRCGDVNAG